MKGVSSKNTKNLPEPPDLPKTEGSVQYDLFAQFLVNSNRDKERVSNTVDLWERIPKYFLSRSEQKKIIPKEGQPDPYEYTFYLKNERGQETEYRIEIQPALIKQPDGRFKAFFPGPSEEIIEEVLKRIFTQQNHGVHDEKNAESWVKFSYSMLKKELERNHCGRTFASIKQSLEIMSRCVLTIYEGEHEVYTGAILQDYCSVNREQYLENTTVQHIARLPVFISQAINTLQFRQFNYGRLMQCKNQFSRWLLKRLINRFTYASLTTDHHFMFSTLKKESGLLRAKRDIDNRVKVLAALDELIEKGAIYAYDADIRKEGKKVIDVCYKVIPTQLFIKEQKAANKREKLIKERKTLKKR